MLSCSDGNSFCGWYRALENIEKGLSMETAEHLLDRFIGFYIKNGFLDINSNDNHCLMCRLMAIKLYFESKGFISMQNNHQ